MSKCVVCDREVTAKEHMVNGEPAVCSWIPIGAGESVYAIVTAHLSCMSVAQLQQCTDSWKRDDEIAKDAGTYRGFAAAIESVVARRLSRLLARGEDVHGGKEVPAEKAAGPDRFSLLEVDE